MLLTCFFNINSSSIFWILLSLDETWKTAGFTFWGEILFVYEMGQKWLKIAQEIFAKTFLKNFLFSFGEKLRLMKVLLVFSFRFYKPRPGKFLFSSCNPKWDISSERINGPFKFLHADRHPRMEETETTFMLSFPHFRRNLGTLVFILKRGSWWKFKLKGGT